MKLSIAVLTALLTIFPSLASDTEQDAQQPDRRELLASIDGLEILFEDARIQSDATVNDALAMFGLQAEELGDAELTAEQRFLNAIPCKLDSLQVKPCLTYQDLLLMRQNGGLRTSRNIFMAMCSRVAGEEDVTHPLSDCRLLNDLTEDMSAYCTIQPYFSVSSEGMVLGANEKTKPSDVSVMGKRAASLGDVTLASGQSNSVTTVPAYKVSAFCPLYRLYRGDRPVAVFSLVTFKIEAQERGPVIEKLLPILRAKLAKRMRKADEQELPDYRTYKG